MYKCTGNQEYLRTCNQSIVMLLIDQDPWTQIRGSQSQHYHSALLTNSQFSKLKPSHSDWNLKRPKLGGTVNSGKSILFVSFRAPTECLKVDNWPCTWIEYLILIL